MADRLIQLSDDALFQEIGGEAVILDLASAAYFGLEQVGVRLWQLLQEDPSLERALGRLETEFEVEPERLREDVSVLVAELIEAGLASESASP